MKKFLSVLLSAVLCLTVLTACGKSYDAQESTLFVLKNGKIISTDVEEFDTSLYSQDEFKDYVESTIAAFNIEAGENSVELISLTVTDNVAMLELEYADCNAFSSFTGIDLFVGSVAEALAAGYTFDGSYVSVDGDDFTDSSASELISAKDYKVAVINSAYRVQVYGTIGYLSVNNMSLIDKNTVSFELGNTLSAAYAEDTEAAAQEVTEESTEAVEVQEETQAEEVEESGSVDDDEMMIGTEEEEEIPTFEFDETTSDSDSASAVTENIGYAYILFK